MANLTTADITDKVIAQHTLTAYLTEADSELADIAESYGITDSDDIEVAPMHFKVKRYMVAYVCMRVCEDNIGLNNVAIPDLDKYMVKYKQYKAACDRLRVQISEEMLLGTVDEARDRAGVSSGTLYRS